MHSQALKTLGNHPSPSVSSTSLSCHLYEDFFCIGWQQWPHKSSRIPVLSSRSKELYFLNENESEVPPSCPTLCDPTDYTGHGILRARILEWVAFAFSRGSSQPSNWRLPFCGLCILEPAYAQDAQFGSVRLLWPLPNRMQVSGQYGLNLA